MSADSATAQPGAGTAGHYRRRLIVWLIATCRFYAVAAMNTAFGYGVYALLILLGLNIYVAQLVARSIGMAFNYVSYSSFVFRSRRLDKRRFVISYGVSYIFAVGLLTLILRFTSNRYLAGLVCTGITSLANLLMLRYFAGARRAGGRSIDDGSRATGRLRSKTAISNHEGYRPYPIDWRFLPERALFIKDYLRHLLVIVVVSAARPRILRGAWLRIVGGSTLQNIRKAGFLFIHVPKTGGTSISKALYGRNLPHFSAAFYADVFGTTIADVPSFAVIRHPVERFVSTYRFLKFGGSDIILTSRYEVSKLQNIQSIDDLVDLLFQDRRWLRILPTLVSQSVFVSDGAGNIMVDRLYSLDRDSGLRPELLAWLGLDHVPHINASRSHPAPLSEGALRKLRQIYAADFALYEMIVSRGGCIGSGGERRNAAEPPHLQPLRAKVR